MPPADDREPRHAHEAAITLRCAATTIHGTSRDLSRGGLCADVPASLPIGAEVQVDVQLMFDDGGRGDTVRLPARVVWCTRVDDGFQIGLAFRPLDPKQNELITALLRDLTDYEPSAQPGPHERAVDDRFG